MLAKTDVEKSTLDQQRSIWLATLESYQHRFLVAREDITAKFHRQYQLLHNDFCFINQKRLERDVVGASSIVINQRFGHFEGPRLKENTHMLLNN
ncbi:hypothetical protein RB213_012072 [Colletotrichum asianum]